MRKIFVLLVSCLAMGAMAQSEEVAFSHTVENSLKKEVKDMPVVVSLKDYGDVQSAVVKLNGEEIPSQLDDLDKDGTFDELAFVCDFKKKEKKTFSITLSNMGEQKEYTPRTFAELMLRNPKVKVKNQQDIYLQEISVTPDTKDPYHLVHHHGVAFESELIAIRIYYDQRQTLDLYGKLKKRLEIKDTQFYTLDEQKAAGYGDDVLWVGNTFGLGALRGWNGSEPTMIDDVQNRIQRIIATGPVRTIVEVEDRGWKATADKPRLNMKIRYTLWAGHRDVDVYASFSRDVRDMLFSTGVINVKDSKEWNNGKDIRGCWGTDWPTGANDSVGHKRETVGLGVKIPQKYIVSMEPANVNNYAYVIRPDENNEIHYQVAYCSKNEEFATWDEDTWFEWLKQW
ncbi:MAG: DUF4861 domain-containing protein [Prevotella sp.]|nr:DUF4861 domain-containing protein [Prevotella sp.]